MKKQKWVLIIENENDGSDLQAMSVQLGYQVIRCTHRSHALWYLQNQKFAFVVVDRGVRLPAFVSSIKNNERHVNNATPFILLNEDPFAHFVDKVRSVVQTT